MENHPSPHVTEPDRSRNLLSAFKLRPPFTSVLGDCSDSQGRSHCSSGALILRYETVVEEQVARAFEPLEKLVTKETNYNARKALIAAECCGLRIPVVIDSELDVPSYEDPFLVTIDGPIHGGNAIAHYVTHLKPDNPLYGRTLFDHGRIEQWIEFSSSQIRANIEACLRSGARRGFSSSFAEAAAITPLKRALNDLDQFLYSKEYLVGDSNTLADIVLTCDLYHGFTQLMPWSFTSEFPRVEKYFWKLVEQPNYKKILGEVKQIESFQPKNCLVTMIRMIPAPFLEHPEKWHLPAQPKEAAKSKPKDEPKKEAEKEGTQTRSW